MCSLSNVWDHTIVQIPAPLLYFCSESWTFFNLYSWKEKASSPLKAQLSYSLPAKHRVVYTAEGSQSLLGICQSSLLLCLFLFIRPSMKQSPTQTLYYTTETQLRGREKRTYALEIPMQMPLPHSAVAASQDVEAGSQVSC